MISFMTSNQGCKFSYVCFFLSSRPCSPRCHLPRRQLMRLKFAGGVDAHISREENEKYRQLVADNTAWVQQHYR